MGEMGKPNTDSPIYCMKDNSENWLSRLTQSRMKLIDEARITNPPKKPKQFCILHDIPRFKKSDQMGFKGHIF